MSMQNSDSEKLIEKTLQNFFSKKDISEFSEEFLRKKLPSSPQAKANKLASIRSHFQFYSKIDLLITFAGSKLERDKYLRLLADLSTATITSGEFSTAIYINETILHTVKGDKKYRDVYANAVLNIGEVFSRQALWQESSSYIKQASEIFKKLNDKDGIAKCENLLGTIHGECGHLNRAREHFEKSLSLLNKKKNIDLIGKLKINLGIISNINGDTEAALQYFKDALVIFRKTNDYRRLAEIRHNMGMMMTKKKRYKSAISEFDRSINTSNKVGYLPSLGISYLGKAYVYTMTGSYKIADSFANKSIDIFHKISDKLAVADAYKVKGIIERGLKRFSLAEDFFLTSLRLNQELKNDLNKAETNFELGLLYLDMDREKEGKAKLRSALRFYEKINDEKEVEKIKDKLHAAK